MMKGRKNITLLAGVLVLAILVVSYVLLHNHNKNADKEKDDKASVSIVKIPQDEITGICFGVGEGKLSFVLEDDTWYSAEDKNFPVDQEAFSTLLSKLSNIEALRTLDSPGELSQYGLDEPRNVISVTKKDGSTVNLNLGDENASVSGCYLNVDDKKDQVYLISTEFSTAFSCKLYDLAVKDTVPQISPTSITSGEIQKGDEKFLLKADTESKTGWTVTNWDGVQKPASSQQVSSAFTKFTSLSYANYVNYNPQDPALYGLDQPSAVLTIDYTETTDTASETTEDKKNGDNSRETQKKQFVLSIGSTDENGDYYVKSGDSKGVYTMNADNINEILNETMDTYLDPYVNNASFADLSKLEVLYSGITYTLESKSVEKEKQEDSKDGNENTETENKYYVNNEEVKSENFLAFYSAVSGMESDSRLKEAPQLSDLPEISLNFYDKADGENIKVDFYPYDSNFYLSVDNNENYLLINKIKVKDMIEKFNNLLDAKVQ